MIKWILNKLGRDSIFDLRPKIKVGPWVIVGLGAGEWVRMRDLMQSAVFDNEDPESRHHTFLGYQMRAIALSVRTKRGFQPFDPENNDDLLRVAEFPRELLEQALEAIADLGMEWLKPVHPDETTTVESSAELESVPRPVGSVPEDFDDGLDYSHEKNKAEPVNPS